MAKSPDAFSEPSFFERLERAGDGLVGMREQLEQTHRLAMLGQVAAGMAHEINNVLTPALSYGHLALSRPDDPELQRKAIDRSVSGIAAATEILQAMLGFAAAQDGSGAADVAEVVEQSLHLVHRDHQTRKVTITRQIPPGLLVQAQEITLKQIIVNLALNAVAAMAEQGGELRIQATSRADETTEIILADTGPGIDPSVASTIFDPFVTGGGAADVSGMHLGGTGLGLAICRQLVTRAGGSISVDSTPGQGATFHIILPTARANRSKAG